jgi:hypothetical protein
MSLRRQKSRSKLEEGRLTAKLRGASLGLRFARRSIVDAMNVIAVVKSRFDLLHERLQYKDGWPNTLQFELPIFVSWVFCSHSASTRLPLRLLANQLGEKKGRLTQSVVFSLDQAVVSICLQRA